MFLQPLVNVRGRERPVVRLDHADPRRQLPTPCAGVLVERVPHHRRARPPFPESNGIEGGDEFPRQVDGRLDHDTTISHPVRRRRASPLPFDQVVENLEQPRDMLGIHRRRLDPVEALAELAQEVDAEDGRVEV